ncbi:MAG: hypothetical protein AABY18_00710 [Candidatus Thermoplasmatota archaeon]
MKPATRAALAHIMKALGNPVRVEILQQLSTPRQVGEIRVAPGRRENGDAPNRSMSRASVQAHLEYLIEVGAVRAISSVRDGRNVTMYVADQRQLFALTEELRQFGRMRVDADAVADGTAPAPAPAGPTPAGPRLVLMNGPWEGRIVPLEGSGPWCIGRAPANALSMPYDPFLSSSNSEVRRSGPSFTVHDLPRARNGTSLNWTPLPRGSSKPLVPGDVVGAGRTLLLFRSD